MSFNDQADIGYIIADIARLLRTVCDRRVRKLGLTRAQWLAVTRLHRRPGLSQSEVAELLEIEKATACRLLDRLEAKKWIERRPDKKDRRVKRIFLTPRANRVYASIWPVAESTVDEALADMSIPERKQLLQMLLRMKSKLQSLAGQDCVIALESLKPQNGGEARTQASA
jgi:DNA-binding MarR family transcriptional regulator|nr:MAG: MarR family transcriptional regulator [Pseudomonadota bacterium]